MPCQWIPSRSLRASQSLNQSSHLPVKRLTPLCLYSHDHTRAISSLPGGQGARLTTPQTPQACKRVGGEAHRASDSSRIVGFEIQFSVYITLSFSTILDAWNVRFSLAPVNHDPPLPASNTRSMANKQISAACAWVRREMVFTLWPTQVIRERRQAGYETSRQSETDVPYAPGASNTTTR